VRHQNARCFNPWSTRAIAKPDEAIRTLCGIIGEQGAQRPDRDICHIRDVPHSCGDQISRTSVVDVPVAITKLISGRVRSVATQGLTARRDDTGSESPRPSFAPQAVHVTLLIVRVPKYLSLHNDVLVRRKSPPWVTSSSRVRRYLAIFQMFISIEDLFWQRISSCEAQQCTTIHVATGGVGYV